MALVVGVCAAGGSTTLATSTGAGAEAWMTGIIAGSGTLLTCWVLLIVGVATWRRLLWNRDLDGWAQEWARVEPSWSNRTGVED